MESKISFTLLSMMTMIFGIYSIYKYRKESRRDQKRLLEEEERSLDEEVRLLRIEKIENWKKMMELPFNRERFVSDPNFGTFREQIPKKLAEQLESPSNQTIVNDEQPSTDWYQIQIQIEINRIEKLWGLN